MDNRPVGFFDSGFGGLTALRAFRKLMPDENIIYFGDTGRMPYGARPAAQLVRIASGYDASMSVEKLDDDGEVADCRSVLSLLMLAAGRGTRLLLRVSGPQAEEAFRAAVDFFTSKFGEE